MEQKTFKIAGIPAVSYGGDSKSVWLFVHGKCGCKEEGAAFADIVCPRGGMVLGVDLPGHGERKNEDGFDPWHVVPELRSAAERLLADGARVSLRANSIGAWFSMLALSDLPIARALFVSPILDMEALIRGMMLACGVDEARLRREGEIAAENGETLSWDYLQYVRAHPIADWRAPTSILYAGQDALTSRDTTEGFARRFGCTLTVMENGEHWFHTPEQLAVLKKWETENV